MKAIILAGGSGTRLWPLSRKNYPKQFMKIGGNDSLLKQTTDRLKGVIGSDDIIVMTNSDYKFHVRTELDALPLKHMILEPFARNTAPAIALGIRYCLEKAGCTENDVILILPADHIIRPAEKFVEYMRKAEEAAKAGKIVTFGIKPSRPETGYGYIKARENVEAEGYYQVERFVEKPDAEIAAEYLQNGNYYWNSGMFAFRIGTILDEFEVHAPNISGMLKQDYESMLRDFGNMPDISIDYAVAEKSDKVVTLPLDLYWNDVGSWDSLYDVLDKDEKGNVKLGDVVSLDTERTLVIGGKRLISTIGLDDCLVIETDDAILIAKKGESQKVKDLVNSLRKAGRKEVDEHITTYRPWGSYTVLEEGPRYKIKRIVVNPSERLSRQMHHHRSEHWVVIKGTAKVTVGEKELNVHENESVYVPKSTSHRLENPGKVPLEIIEVQNGEYVGEDDIVRLDDIYGRS